MTSRFSIPLSYAAKRKLISTACILVLGVGLGVSDHGHDLVLAGSPTCGTPDATKTGRFVPQSALSTYKTGFPWSRMSMQRNGTLTDAQLQEQLAVLDTGNKSSSILLFLKLYVCEITLRFNEGSDWKRSLPWNQ
jgi:hypothetical protein